MKKIILTEIFILVAVLIQAQNFTISDKFPIEKLDFYTTTNNPKIVVFMPSLFDDCEYASMLTNALYFYFTKGLTFQNEIVKPVFDIILVVNDTNKWNRNNSSTERIDQNKTEGMTIYYDSTGMYFKKFGIMEYKDTKVITNDSLRKGEKTSIAPFYVGSPLVRNQSSTLFLLDINNNILLKDQDYRSQGEHLKPLDNFIKEKFCHSKINKKFDYPKLKVGDKAPNFLIDTQKDFNGDNDHLRVITFYPAAFSGTLKPRRQNMEIMTCAGQLTKFDAMKINLTPEKSKIKGIKRYAISNSTEGLLYYWENLLGISQIIFLNDRDNSIAGKYNALNTLGYNRRLTYIVDEKNTIRYIDEEFTKDSEATITAKIKEILSKK